MAEMELELMLKPSVMMLYVLLVAVSATAHDSHVGW